MAWLRTESDGIIHTSSGLNYKFIAGIAQEIPDRFSDELILKGCTSEDKNFTHIQIQDTKNLDEVLKLIIEEGDPNNFKVDKTPKINVVNSLLDNKLPAREITSRFQELMSNDFN